MVAVVAVVTVVALDVPTHHVSLNPVHRYTKM